VAATFGTLKTEVSKALRDPSMTTFVVSDVEALVNMAVSEVGRIAPQPFQEDIEPVANALTYTLRAAEFGSVPIPEIEVSRVELWDTTVTPAQQKYIVPAAAAAYRNDSQAGWINWGGVLSVPRYVPTYIDVNTQDFVIRVWGYSPYTQMSSDSDLFDGSDDLKWAIVAYCRLEALERLLADRDLYSQWQTRAGNTDMSPAGLMSALNQARDEWRRKSQRITRLRAQV
jgi:hypothetical protein